MGGVGNAPTNQIACRGVLPLARRGADSLRVEERVLKWAWRFRPGRVGVRLFLVKYEGASSRRGNRRSVEDAEWMLRWHLRRRGLAEAETEQHVVGLGIDFGQEDFGFFHEGRVERLEG